LSAVDGTRNLVITGFIATGKTTVGRRVAESMGRAFVDTDSVIEERHGPIAAIFAGGGEAAFRQMERDLAVELGQRSGLVIATGGGMLLDPEACEALTRSGRVFCLAASPDEIHRRVLADGERRDRPLLQVEDPRRRIGELLAERSPQYERFTQVPTDGLTPDEVAGRLVELWGAGDGS